MSSPARTYRMTARAEGVERTRERILAAAREHFLSTYYDDVTLTGIARDAGVTQQTLLNHFSSKEGLLLVLLDDFRAEVLDLRGTPAPGDTDAAVRGLVRQYEKYGRANVRVAELADRVPALAELIADGRAQHLAWLERVFDAVLPPEPAARRRALAQLYAVTDVFTWRLLRHDLGHSRAETTTVLQSMLRAVVAALPAT